jgi:rfaE bifunctional protein kinase chain/domain
MSLAKLVEDFSGKHLVVLGDVIADQFIYGEISRVSREAPVFILRHEQTKTSPGGAGNCAMNLAALGAQVELISVLGNDEPGRALLNTLTDAGVNCDAVSISEDLRTTTKVRVLAGQIHSTRQQVIRIDYDNEPELRSELQEKLRVRAIEAATSANAIIISDYNYGAASPRIAAPVREVVADNIPILVDSRFRLSEFSRFTSATPNEDEVEQLLSIKHTDQSALEAAAEQLRQQLGYKALLVTRGSNGMTLIEAGAAPLHFDAVGSRQPLDVTGAGDTVIATYALALASGASFADAARLANLAGGIVVMKAGTATVTRAELMCAVIDHDQESSGAGLRAS